MTLTITDAALKYAEVQDGRIAYREYGIENGGLPLVLLSRFRGTIDDWDAAVVNRLAADRHVVAFDSSGVGLSEGRVPATVTAMADTAIAFIDALGLQKADLLGFSMGGYIGQRIALKRPDLVHALVLVGTGPGGGEGATYPGSVVADSLEMNPLDALQALFFTSSRAGRVAAEGYFERTNTASRPEGSTVTEEASTVQRAAILKWWNGDDSTISELDQIQVPVLVVNGSDDVMVPTPNAFLMSQRIPNAQLVIYPDAGHGSLFQYPVTFTRHVLQFLEAQVEGGIA